MWVSCSELFNSIAELISICGVHPCSGAAEMNINIDDFEVFDEDWLSTSDLSDMLTLIWLLTKTTAVGPGQHAVL